MGIPQRQHYRSISACWMDYCADWLWYFILVSLGMPHQLINREWYMDKCYTHHGRFLLCNSFKGRC